MTIVTLPGDGIGPEVTAAAVRVLRAVVPGVEIQQHLIGGAAVDETGLPLPAETLSACVAADAVLLGAVGGPAWDGEPPATRPEAGLLGLRKGLGVFANLRPVSVAKGMEDFSPLENSRVAGTDVLIVRELTGGIYFGQPRMQNTELARNTMVYSRREIERIARVGFEWARKRRRHVTLVDKANVLEVSRLWRATVEPLHAAEFADVALDFMYVDNAAMQMVLNPGRFDVILTGNLFGDILSDLAATLPGSLGLLPSASLGGTTPLFEPVHGSAPDIAGQDRANPTAAILCVAMLLDTLGRPTDAHAIRTAVAHTLRAGPRTADLAGTASTTAFTDAILRTIEAPDAGIPDGASPTDTAGPDGAYPTEDANPDGAYPTEDANPDGAYPTEDAGPVETLHATSLQRPDEPLSRSRRAPSPQ